MLFRPIQGSQRPFATPEVFVTVWQTSCSVWDVALRQVLAWERRCCREGVRLKKMADPRDN